MAIRRTLLTGFPPLQGKVEDNMLTLRAVLAGDCLCLQEALLGYRRHDSNLGDWVFDRSGSDYAAYERRNRRVLAMYREIAEDQARCVAARPDLPEDRRRLGAAAGGHVRARGRDARGGAGPAAHAMAVAAVARHPASRPAPQEHRTRVQAAAAAALVRARLRCGTAAGSVADASSVPAPRAGACAGSVCRTGTH